jgi:HlyD family secretion protein
VVVAFDNSDLKLRPYMTANLQFEVEEHKDVLQVPNAALRWKPRPEQVVPELREKIASTLASKPGDRVPQNAAKSPDEAKSPDQAKSAKAPNSREDRGRVWIADGKFVKPIDVQIGATDGTQTEISGDDVTEGMKVVLGEAKGDKLADSSDTTNPFAPKIFRGRGGR